jgi:oxygen-dependent protoporphyrinogen oxidase
MLVESLSAQLRHPPLLGVNVRRIAASNTSPRPEWIASASGQEAWTADALVLACPAYSQAELLADVDHVLAEQIASISYNRVAVVAVGFRQTDVPGSLAGFGYIAPQRTRRDVLGVQWCSSIFPERSPKGTVLLRALCGGWHRPDVVSWDDERLLAAVCDDLGASLGITVNPIMHHIVRWERAIPQYHLGHLERVAKIEALTAGHPGLFLTGNAYHGVSLNDCTEQAAATASKVAKYLSSTPIA